MQMKQLQRLFPHSQHLLLLDCYGLFEVIDLQLICNTRSHTQILQIR